MHLETCEVLQDGKEVSLGVLCRGRTFTIPSQMTRRPRLWREVRGLGATLVLRGRGARPSFTGRQRS